MHAVALAQELGVSKVVVPAGASVFSAWGMMMSDLRRDYVVTRLADLAPENAAAIESAFADAEERARRQFAAEGFDASQVRFARFGRFRYRNQEHSTEVQLGKSPVSAQRVAAIEAAFHDAYEREYTYRLDAPVEMVGFHLVASVEVGKLTLAKREATKTDVRVACKGQRMVDYALEGRHRAAVFDGESLEPGMRFEGPAHRRGPRNYVGAPPREPRRGGRLRQHPNSHRRLRTTHMGATNDPITLEIIQNSLQSAGGRDVRGDEEDRDELDHLRGARHGHRNHGRPG